MGQPNSLDSDEWHDRALLAEADFECLRCEIREYIAWLMSPDRGPVIFRDEVAARLERILAP